MRRWAQANNLGTKFDKAVVTVAGLMIQCDAYHVGSLPNSRTTAPHLAEKTFRNDGCRKSQQQFSVKVTLSNYEVHCCSTGSNQLA